ncbi:MAG: ABC transporter substrate-binding protein [Dehalococcoidia bacterium]
MKVAPRLATIVLAAVLSVASLAFAQSVGGTFTAALASGPPTLDVITSTAGATRRSTWFFLESLITYDENFVPAPLLAERWDVSDDGRTYTFHLKQDVTFHDGQTMTSADVIASIDRYMAISPRASSFENVVSYEATDDHTVVFTLDRPSASFLDALAYPVAYLAIMPASVIEGKGVGELPWQEMVGTGPYRLADYRPDDLVRFERFDDYHSTEGATDGLTGNKTAYFDTVVLRLVPEAGARMAGLETGEYDFAQDIPFTEYERLVSNAEIEPYVLRPERWTVLDFNYCDPLSQSLDFRRAVQYALDMDAIGTVQASGVDEFYRVQGSLFFTESPWHTEVGTEPYNIRDLEQARAYLEASPYDGEEVVLLTNRNFDYMFNAILVAADTLERDLGMNVRVDILDWPAQRAMWVDTPGWHIDVTGFLSQASFAPDAYASIYHSDSNRKCHANEELDELFVAAASAPDDATRRNLYDEIQATFYDDVTAIKTVDLFGLHGMRSDIQGFAPWYNITRFWNIWRE